MTTTLNSMDAILAGLAAHLDSRGINIEHLSTPKEAEAMTLEEAASAARADALIDGLSAHLVSRGVDFDRLDRLTRPRAEATGDSEVTINR
jgi:hypothetical protein